MKYKLTYSDKLPKGVNGRCFYPLIPKFGTCKIVIRPKFRHNKCILLHELVHVKQYRRNWLHDFMYSFFKDYRYKAELEAYGTQMKCHKRTYKTIKDVVNIINALYYNYGLELSYDAIELDVQRIIDSINKKG